MTWGLKTETLEIDGTSLTVRELSAAEAAELWDLITEGEASGNMLKAFRAVVLCATHRMTGEPLFRDQADLDKAPMRVIGVLANKVLELSEIGVDQGNSNGALADDSPIS